MASLPVFLLFSFASLSPEAAAASWTGAELLTSGDWTEMSYAANPRTYTTSGTDLIWDSGSPVACGSESIHGGRCISERTFRILPGEGCTTFSGRIVYTSNGSPTANSVDNDFGMAVGNATETLIYYRQDGLGGVSSTGIGRTTYSSFSDPDFDTFTTLSTAAAGQLAIGTVVTIDLEFDLSGSTWTIDAETTTDADPTVKYNSVTAPALGTVGDDVYFFLVSGDRSEEYVIHSMVLEATCETSYIDPVVDTDGDGVDDEDDNCPDDANADQADLDEDGLGDACDTDADGDGDLNTVDCDDLDPSRYTAAIEICDDLIDNDCDGDIDLDDTDVDLDAPDSDCDGDGVVYTEDNCVCDFNPGQSDLDADLDGDVCDLDDDGDGVDDDVDNCPVDANASQTDTDGDGDGDACDDDSDGDGVLNENDLCDATTADAPTKALGQNRWADVDGDGEFDTKGKNPTGRYFTMDDTLGCSCEQIIDTCDYGAGHSKHGCSNSVMDTWTGLYDEDGGVPGTCKAE
jgi:hypothetical protein